MAVQLNLFDTPVDPDKPKQLPTLSQYLKSCTKVQLGQTFQVEIIWLPNKFSNFTLQTHAFRVRISESNAMYATLDSVTKHLTGDKTAWGIKVHEDKSGKYTIVPMEKKKGEWGPLGANGITYKDQ